MRILFALIAFCSIAHAEPGLSYLGMCHQLWPCQASMKAFDGLPVIRTGWLMQTFADDCRCAATLLQDPRPKEIRVHIANWTCARNQRCGQYEIFAGLTTQQADRKVREKDPALLKKFQAVLEKTQRLLQNARGGLKLYVSPCLECDLSDASRKILLDLTAKAFPHATLVDSVFRPQCLPNVVCEKHGDAPSGLRSPCGVDTDGIDFQKIDVPKYFERYQHCDYSHLWMLRFNLNDPHITNFIDPRKRITAPTSKHFEVAAAYIRPGGAELPPLTPLDPQDTKGCKKMLPPRDGAGGFVLKDSDTHPGSVALLKKGFRPKRMTLVKNGKTVTDFKYAADFHGDGRPIYRAPLSVRKFPTNAVLRSELGCFILDRGFRYD